MALFSFNLGVELGGLAIIAALALLLHCLPRKEGPEEFLAPAWIRRIGSAAIVVLGLTWFVQRI